MISRTLKSCALLFLATDVTLENERLNFSSCDQWYWQRQSVFLVAQNVSLELEYGIVPNYDSIVSGHCALIDDAGGGLELQEHRRLYRSESGRAQIHEGNMTRDIRICFVGDSFVNGTNDETALGWAGRLVAAAHAAGKPVTGYNLGIRRDTSLDVRRRWQGECAPRLPDGCDGRIVFSFGVNDTFLENGAPRIPLAASRANAREILRDATRYKVLMLGPPPVDDAAQNARILQVSETLEQEARALAIPFIDLFSPLARDAAYIGEISANDGSHPGSVGYARMAGIVLDSPAWWFRG